MDDLEAAIWRAKVAVSATSEDNSNKALMLNNLATMLSTRYKITGNIDDLEGAISIAKMAVSATSYNDPDKATTLDILGT